MKNNPVGWFEIPVSDMERAMKFYSTVFTCEISRHQVGEEDMGWFPFSNEAGASGVTGSLVCHKEYIPSDKGSMLYFTCEDVSVELARVEAAGGKIVQHKKEIGDGHGFMGLFLDTEGNRIGVHSRK